MCSLILEQLEVYPNFAKQIIFSDEVHFWMNGYVNKQNCRIWDDTNSGEIHQLQIPRKSLFGADFALAESSVRTSSKTKRCHNRQQ